MPVGTLGGSNIHPGLCGRHFLRRFLFDAGSFNRRQSRRQADVPAAFLRPQTALQSSSRTFSSELSPYPRNAGRRLRKSNECVPKFDLQPGEKNAFLKRGVGCSKNF
jgi:hypothetical protein